MMRMLVALLGLALFMALFAGIHYSQDPVEFRERSLPAFVLGPDEVLSSSLHPSLPDTVIQVTLDVRGGPIDVYAVPSEQASRLPRGGTLHLDTPFSYDARWSRTNVTGMLLIPIVSDGRTSYDLILDNSDNYYDDDATPNGTVTVELTARYIAKEQQSLVFGYLAVVPSILLVAVTVTLKLRRRAARRSDRSSP